MWCTTSIEMKMSKVKSPANGRVLQRTASTSGRAPGDSAVTSWAHGTGTVLCASRAVTPTTSSQGAVTGTRVWTASGLREVTGAFVSRIRLSVSVYTNPDVFLCFVNSIKLSSVPLK